MVKAAPLQIAYLSDDLPAERIADLCSDQRSIAEALDFKFSSSSLFRIDVFDAVYVIAPDDLPVAKVGIARTPAKRLAGLQCGNWNRLSIKALFWCFDNAGNLESSVLKQVKKHGAHMLGEWAALDPANMIDLVASCAKSGGYKIGDSRCWLESWIPWASQQAVQAKIEHSKRMGSMASGLLQAARR